MANFFENYKKKRAEEKEEWNRRNPENLPTKMQTICKMIVGVYLLYLVYKMLSDGALERKDFPQLVELLVAAYKKWPTGVFAVWYPIKDRAMIERFEKKMFKTGIRRQLICEVCVWPDDTPVGLNGCGLLVINPPWKFSEDADEALQWLFPHLRMSENGGHAAVRWLVGE